MNPVGAERECGLDVVVDDEGRGQVDEWPSGLDHVCRRSALKPELNYGRTALYRVGRSLEVGHDRVQPHALTFARESSVNGSRLESAS
jgi:hypothetical protein